jgi:flagellar biosynthesis/type III secretory pathway protein FliH
LSPEELEDLEKREMFIEDQRGAIIKGIQQGIQQGIQEGIQQGIQEGQQALIMRLLERRVGEIVPEILNRISQLSSEELENLGVALFDFTSASDLMAWLQSHN